MSGEDLKEAANFFSVSNSAPVLHAPSSPFDFANLQNALPVVNHQRLQPAMSQQPVQSNLSGSAWASDFMSFQQTRPGSTSERVVTASPSFGVQNPQQPLQNPGL